MVRSDDYTDCQNEQQFKMKWLKINELSHFTKFCIETEETVKGFPDVMFIDNDTKQTWFAEFKFTKPSFYKKYYHLPIKVIAYNAKTNIVHFIMKEDLFRESGAYKMNEKAEVDLCRAEKLIGLRRKYDNESSYSKS